MSKHRGSGDARPGTDTGPAFGELTPEDKGAEFDASTEDPRGYAERNFGADPDSAGTFPLG
jgi:hypothetical protein